MDALELINGKLEAVATSVVDTKEECESFFGDTYHAFMGIYSVMERDKLSNIHENEYDAENPIICNGVNYHEDRELEQNENENQSKPNETTRPAESLEEFPVLQVPRTIRRPNLTPRGPTGPLPGGHGSYANATSRLNGQGVVETGGNAVPLGPLSQPGQQQQIRQLAQELHRKNMDKERRDKNIRIK